MHVATTPPKGKTATSTSEDAASITEGVAASADKKAETEATAAESAADTETEAEAEAKMGAIFPNNVDISDNVSLEKDEKPVTPDVHAEEVNTPPQNSNENSKTVNKLDDDEGIKDIFIEKDKKHKWKQNGSYEAPHVYKPPSQRLGRIIYTYCQ